MKRRVSYHAHARLSYVRRLSTENLYIQRKVFIGLKDQFNMHMLL